MMKPYQIDTTQNGEGYFMAGNRSRISDSIINNPAVPFIAKLNKNGLSVWEKYIDSLPGNIFFERISAIKHTIDEGCIVFCDTYLYNATGFYNAFIIIARFDSSGIFVWSKTLSGSKYQEAGRMCLCWLMAASWLPVVPIREMEIFYTTMQIRYCKCICYKIVAHR